MTTVLIASYLEPEHVAQIEAAFPQVRVIYRPDLLGQPRYVADHTALPSRTLEQEREWRSLLARADVLFDFDYSHAGDLPDLAPNVRWIQATSAGIGEFVERMNYARRTDWQFTTASGIHAGPLAEFVMFAMLYFEKDFAHLQAEKAAQHWQRYTTGELAGKTVSIIGLGQIGREVARRARCFNMRVIGSRRDPSQPVESVDALYGPDNLRPLLEATDFLVLVTPHTRETQALIGAAELALLPRGAVFINIGRGAVVDQPALVRALESGHLRGAALDVFATEPLPPDDPLWALPNLIISPHSASTALSENSKLTDLFIENLRRWLAGEPLLNQFDPQRQY